MPDDLPGSKAFEPYPPEPEPDEVPPEPETPEPEEPVLLALGEIIADAARNTDITWEPGSGTDVRFVDPAGDWLEVRVGGTVLCLISRRSLLELAAQIAGARN